MYDLNLPEPETVRRSDGVLVGVLGDRVVACDTAGHQAHIVDGLLAWLLLLDGTTPFSDLVADVNATTGAAPAIARKDLRQAVALGTSLHLLGRSAAAPRRARPFETSPTSLSEVVGLLGQVAGGIGDCHRAAQAVGMGPHQLGRLAGLVDLQPRAARPAVARAARDRQVVEAAVRGQGSASGMCRGGSFWMQLRAGSGPSMWATGAHRLPAPHFFISCIG